MRIDVKGRNLSVSDELRDHVAKRFRKVERQVSELATLEVEVFEERNPRVSDCQVAEATLHVKRATLRARGASPDIMRSVTMVSEELARQVKRHRDRRRRRREARAAAAQGVGGSSTADREATLEEGTVVLKAEAGRDEWLPPGESSIP
jgi:putative sigma-54 modulation protein